MFTASLSQRIVARVRSVQSGLGNKFTQLTAPVPLPRGGHARRIVREAVASFVDDERSAEHIGRLQLGRTSTPLDEQDAGPA
jgi:hypothetical protein